MIDKSGIPPFLLEIFRQLRRRGFLLGQHDFQEVADALMAGFGWKSRDAFRDLLCSLWAKSLIERDILYRVYDQVADAYQIGDWQLGMHGRERGEQEIPSVSITEENATLSSSHSNGASDQQASSSISQKTETLLNAEPEAEYGMPPIPNFELYDPQQHFIFIPEYSLTYREIAQVWRRLRFPIREGPPVELDIQLTIKSRVRRGFSGEVVLIPRRRNITRLLLLVDRMGSMMPMHALVDDVCAAIQNSSNMKQSAVFYFHDSPGASADEQVLTRITNKSDFTLDEILSEIKETAGGEFYTSPTLAISDRYPLAQVSDVLADFAPGAAVVIISDAGAIRGHYDRLRLLDTISFLKKVKQHTKKIVWLNPSPKTDWKNTTAAYIARHISMFPMDKRGLYKAVDALRGRPSFVEAEL